MRRFKMHSEGNLFKIRGVSVCFNDNIFNEK